MMICPYCQSSYLRDHPEEVKSHLLLKCGICGLVLKKKDARRLKDAKSDAEYQDIKKHVLKVLINH